MPGVIASLDRDRDQLHAAGAELVLVTGDLTTFGCAQVDHLKRARQWLDELGLPYLAIPGNHDLSPSAQAGDYEDLPYAETGYGRTFDPDPVHVRDLGQVRVIAAGLRERDPDGVLPRISALIQADSRPVILATHYPVLGVREPKVHKYFGSDEFVPESAQALLEIVRANQNVVLYACGHIHVSTTERLAPHCLQVTAGSLGQGASTYRIYDVDDSGLTYSTAMGTGPLTFWEHSVTGLDADFSLGRNDERTGRITW
jgi:Icc protein